MRSFYLWGAYIGRGAYIRGELISMGGLYPWGAYKRQFVVGHLQGKKVCCSYLGCSGLFLK